MESSAAKNTTIIVVFFAAIVISLIFGFLVGQDRGEKKGKDSVKSEYVMGAPKYEAIYNTGKSAGLAAGTIQGKTQGLKSGKRKGEKEGKVVGYDQGNKVGSVQGANDAFDGFPGGWQVGSYYIVQIGAGSHDVNYVISNRKPMAPNVKYKLCNNNPSAVCTVTAQ